MSQNEGPYRFLKPEEIPAVDLDHFIFAFSVGDAAASYRMPMKSQCENKFVISDDKESQEFVLTDNPLNRATLAIREQCGDDGEMFQAVMYRLFALMKVLDNKKIQRWTRVSAKKSDGIEIHPAVLEAAASLPLNKRGRFQVQGFLKAVEAIAANGKYVVE